MKKVMLFTIALLFSVGANAANITIDNIVSNNAILNVPAATDLASWTAGGPVDIQNNVTAATTGDVLVTWTINSSALSGTVTQYNPSTGIDDLVNVAGLNSYSYVFNMIGGTVYQMNFSGEMVYYSNVGLTVIKSVSPVPVPAALWLFAPALMGLMGLRRKSSKGLVVA